MVIFESCRRSVITPVAAVFLLLMACSKVISPPVAAPNACPQIKNYTRQQQAAILMAETQLPDNSPLIGALIDYRNLRKELAACLSH